MRMVEGFSRSHLLRKISAPQKSKKPKGLLSLWNEGQKYKENPNTNQHLKINTGTRLSCRGTRRLRRPLSGPRILLTTVPSVHVMAPGALVLSKCQKPPCSPCWQPQRNTRAESHQCACYTHVHCMASTPPGVATPRCPRLEVLDLLSGNCVGSRHPQARCGRKVSRPAKQGSLPGRGGEANVGLLDFNSSVSV